MSSYTSGIQTRLALKVWILNSLLLLLHLLRIAFLVLYLFWITALYSVDLVKLLKPPARSDPRQNHKQVILVVLGRKLVMLFRKEMLVNLREGE